jgi:hypothetical protein
MESDSDFVVVLARRDGSRKFVTDDPLTVGMVRDLIRSGTADTRPGWTADKALALDAGKPSIESTAAAIVARAGTAGELTRAELVAGLDEAEAALVDPAVSYAVDQGWLDGSDQ